MFEGCDVSGKLADFLTGDWWEVLGRISLVLAILVGAVTGVVKFAYGTTKRVLSSLVYVVSGTGSGSRFLYRCIFPGPKEPSTPSVLCSRITQALESSECLWESSGDMGMILCGDLGLEMVRTNHLSDWRISTARLAGYDPLDHLELEDRERVYKAAGDVISRKENSVKRGELVKMITSLRDTAPTEPGRYEEEFIVSSGARLEHFDASELGAFNYKQTPLIAGKMPLKK